MLKIKIMKQRVKGTVKVTAQVISLKAEGGYWILDSPKISSIKDQETSIGAKRRTSAFSLLPK